ncbi:MAG: hypothetical protein R3C26_03720 [Calditrichia bacterium]
MLYRLVTKWQIIPNAKWFLSPVSLESIISFDELWFIIQNYSTNYFKKSVQRRCPN